MENIIEKAREYILALKDAGSFTLEDMANMSGIPLQTVRNICSGKHEAKFGSIINLVISMGGDLNELVGYERKKEIEVNSTVSLKETYEMRISDLIRSYDLRIEDMKNFCELRISDIQAACEKRISDIKQSYEERLEEQKTLLMSVYKG